MKPQRPNLGQHHRGFKVHKDPDGPRRPSIEADNGLTATITTSNLELRTPCTKNEFVRRWLVQTEEGDEAPGGIYDASKDSNKHRENKLLLPAESMYRHNAIYQDESYQVKKRRKRQWRRSSSDSSLLDCTAPIRLDSLSRRDAPQKYGNRDQPLSRLQAKRKAEIIDTEMPELSRNHKETFERRPRRKTREDLYEPKDENRGSELPRREKQPGTKRVKKSDRKRASRRTGEDLMRNFSSENIAHDRLTFLPSQGLGLFNNGRTSSPQKRRGLPDLASSEMMFLQRLTRDPATNKPDKAGSKSREKERRRFEREQIEISTFFKPQRAPLGEAVRYSRETSSTHMSDEQPTARKQTLDHGYEKGHVSFRTSDSGPRGIKSNQLSRFSGAYCTPSGPYPPRKILRQESDPPGLWPGNGSTCVTWSETQTTPVVISSSRQGRNIGQPQTSPMPDSIRRSLAETGIFRDTGIESTIALNPSREMDSQEKRASITEIPSTPSNRNQLQMMDKSTTPSTMLFESHRQRLVLLKKRDSYQENGNQKNKKGFFHRIHEQHLCGKKSSKMKHPPLGSNQSVRSSSVTSLVRDPGSIRSTPPSAAQLSCSQTPHDSICPLMTREQLAQKARIKRQSVTLPASKDAKTKMLSNENEAQVVNPNTHDYQEEGNKSNMNDTTAPAKCTTSLSKASGNAETRHESRGEETSDHVQETDNQEIPIITRPNSPIHRTQPAIACPIPEAFDNRHIITESSAPPNQTNQELDPLIVGNCLTIHPNQSPLINWMTRPTSRPSYLAPIAEYTQGDSVQLHDMEHMPYEIDYIGEQYRFPFENEKTQAAAYVEHSKYEFWEDEYAAIAIQRLNSIYDGTTGLEGPQGDHKVQHIIPDLLEGQEQFTYGELGDSELWFGDLKTDPQVVGDILPGSTTNALSWNRRADTGHDQANGEADDALRGFWRPRRTY